MPFEKSLKALCEKFRVERLYLFGSAAHGKFQPERSDLDFLVTMEDQSSSDYSDNYLDLAKALEKLFERRVDLVTERSLRNPYLRETIFNARTLLYERHDEKAAA
ncbi:MAG: nucleotidyltransferase domain-containing protein [Verrucomicrobiota bacterium]|nr:nucleotidyltransferase domain-containing protein [Verrucomicrobiota bacterium]